MDEYRYMWEDAKDEVSRLHDKVDDLERSCDNYQQCLWDAGDRIIELEELLSEREAEIADLYMQMAEE